MKDKTDTELNTKPICNFMRIISRREFLKNGALITGVVGLSLCSLNKSKPNENGSITPDTPSDDYDTTHVCHPAMTFEGFIYHRFMRKV